MDKSENYAVHFEDGIPTFTLSDMERGAITGPIALLGPTFAMATAPNQLQIAHIVVAHVRVAAPKLAGVIARKDAAILRVRGLPVTEDGAPLLATVLSLLRGGEVMQFQEQLGGVLTAPITPKPDAAPNSNASADPFGLHSDEAAMNREFRTEEIALLAVQNPPGTLTGFSILDEALP